jgi:hypothetical protein
MNNLFEQISNISKASAYDILVKQVQELKDEKDALQKLNDKMAAELYETICDLRGLSAQGRLTETGKRRLADSVKIYETYQATK